MNAAKFPGGRNGGCAHSHMDDERTVRNVVLEYIRRKEYASDKEPLSPSTINGYRKILAGAFPDLMDMRICDLDDDACQTAIYNECRRKAARKEGIITPKTVQNEWGLISAALRAACGISFNVRLPKQRSQIKILPPVEAIIEAVAGTEIELPVLLAMWCSLRRSEILALDDLSVHGDYLIINKTLIEGRIRYATKTDASTRAVHLPDYIRSLIVKRLMEARDAGEKSPIRLVPIDEDALYKRFVRSMEKAGYKMSFHDLRHVFATVSLSILHLPEKEVQIAGGWKSPHVMKNVYSNIMPGIVRNADRARDEYFSKMIDAAKKVGKTDND